MNCSITDLRCKEVINSKNGCRIGQVCDVEIDTCTGSLVSIIVWGRPKGFGFFGREEDIKICWQDIEVIGDDTILVCSEIDCCRGTARNKKSGFDGLFKF
ncbi:MAG: YlmC/YmxH family sporulation protein [Clostridia bacterium]|nr:YlmC/YmxH family sporulation protein [Clostridia bacterium]